MDSWIGGGGCCISWVWPREKVLGASDFHLRPGYNVKPHHIPSQTWWVLMRYPCVWRLVAALAELQAGDFQSLPYTIKNSTKALKHSVRFKLNQLLWLLIIFYYYLKICRLQIFRGIFLDSVGTVLPVDYGISGHSLINGALHCLPLFLSQC